ncbi:MAG: diguanylate cyclase [Roseibium sp.]
MTGTSFLRQLFQKTSGTGVALIVAIVCFLAGVTVTAHIGSLVRNELVSQHKHEAIARISEARARFEGAISSTVAHGLGIRDFISQVDDRPFDPAVFEEIATDLIEANPSVRSVGLAPNNILRAVYPFQPNQAAIGLNYRMNTAQWPAIREAMLSRTVIIAGPLDLIQGGSSLLIRIPVFPSAYPRQPMEERTYWGVATLVLDQVGLLKTAGLSDMVNGIRIAIINKGSSKPDTAHVFGSKTVIEKDHVSLPLHLPGGLNWELLGYPENGWSTTGEQIWLTHVVGSLISLVFGAMAFFLISEVYKVRSMALQDPLTGLANRRLLEDRMHQLAVMAERTGKGFQIFYVDLDAFKPVNDNYGHAVGDQLLIEVGHRLQQQTRQTDTVARVGGDEFMVLTPGNMRGTEKDAFLNRLVEKVSRVFVCSGAHIQVKASIGCASYPGDAATIEDLMRVADSRMYAQKAKSKHVSDDIAGSEIPQPG